VFHSNYVPILYRFGDVARYWSNIANFNPPHLYLAPQDGRDLVGISPRFLASESQNPWTVSLGLQARLGSFSSIYSALVDSPADFGLLREQSSPKCVILCLGCRRTAMQNMTPLALAFILGGEIRICTNTHTRAHIKQTVTDISTPCLSACVDKNG